MAHYIDRRCYSKPAQVSPRTCLQLVRPIIFKKYVNFDGRFVPVFILQRLIATVPTVCYIKTKRNVYQGECHLLCMSSLIFLNTALIRIIGFVITTVKRKLCNIRRITKITCCLSKVAMI